MKTFLAFLLTLAGWAALAQDPPPAPGAPAAATNKIAPAIPSRAVGTNARPAATSLPALPALPAAVPRATPQAGPPAPGGSPSAATPAAAGPASAVARAAVPAATPAPAPAPSAGPSGLISTPLVPRAAPPAPAPVATNAAPVATNAAPASPVELLGATNEVVQGRAGTGGDYRMNFNNMPMEQVLEHYAKLTERTVLRENKLAGDVTIRTQTGLTKQEAIQALDTVLAMNGVATILVGDKFVKVVPKDKAAAEAAVFSTNDPKNLPEADQLVSQIVTLTNVLPSEIANALTPFSKISAKDSIVALDSSKVIILRDFAANVKRMMEVIARIDVIPEHDYKLEVIPIKFGKVEDIYSTMSSIIGGGGGGLGGGGIAPSATGARGRAGTGSRTGGAGAGRAGGGLQGRSGQQFQPQAGLPGAPASQSSFQQRLQNIVNRASGGDAQLLGDAKIVPDSRSNSLLVFANKQDMEMITNIVSKVDVLLAQVLIEAIILDVSIGTSRDLGVSAVQNPRTFGKLTAGGGINNGQGFLSSVTNFGSGLPGGFSYFGKYAGDFDVAFKAIATDNRAQVLQTPRVQTSHAVPASFFNGRTVPYITSSYYGGGGLGYGPSSQYQQLEVGVELSVTPYITPDGLVVMEIEQNIDEISGSTHIDNVGDVPNTTKRSATSTVSVRNGDTILLGGFIRTNKEKGKSGVPILKDVPLLGALFRSQSDKNDRSELIILLRPTILPKPQDAAIAAQDELKRLPGIQHAKEEFDKDQRDRAEDQLKDEQKAASKKAKKK